MGFSKKKYIILFSGLVLALFLCAGLIFAYKYVASHGSSKDYVYASAPVSVITPGDASAVPPPQKLQNPPTVIRAIYMTGWSAGAKNYYTYLDSLFNNTQINAVVVDVKDYSGTVSYQTDAEPAKQYGAGSNRIPDINVMINYFHSRGIYVIGRVTVFEDPILAKNRPDLAIYDKSKTTDPSKPVLWENSGGLNWVDPSSPQVWNYDIAIAKDAFSHGFDEINFDYVRFPTDGNADNMGFPVWNGTTPRADVIKSFFQKLRASFPNEKISADIFGQVTTNTDDMGIGQILENSFAYFDYVCPMVYPSHYANGFMGFANPADHPYDIINYAMTTALAREKVYQAVQEKLNGNSSTQIPLAKIRPWLQDFNLGATYNADMVSQEIKATSDGLGADYSGYMLWNAANVYTQGAIAKNTATN